MKDYIAMIHEIRSKYVGDDKGLCRKISFDIIDRVRMFASQVLFVRTTKHPIVGEHALVVFEDDDKWIAVDAARNQLGYADGVKIAEGEEPCGAITNLGYDPSLYTEQIIHKESYIGVNLKNI